jgi:hypothetical protein
MERQRADQDPLVRDQKKSTERDRRDHPHNQSDPNRRQDPRRRDESQMRQDPVREEQKKRQDV